MAPDDKTSDACSLLQRGAITELLALHRRTFGTAVMAEETAEEKAAREKAEADAKAGKGKDDDSGEPSEEELKALGDAGKRALERVRAERDKLREQAEAAAEKARKYDELENAKLSEAEKLAAEKDAADKRATKAETDLAKLQAVLAVGLPASAASRISGTTPAELKKDAEAYKAELDEVAGGRKRRTTGDQDKGGDGPTGGMSSLIRRAAGRTA